MVLPIAAAGLAFFGDDSALADTFVLALPQAAGRDALALFAYVGGFSAATGMVIVASVALAIMVSNDLVMPLLLRSDRGQRHVASTVLWVRRAAILCFALFAYGYYLASSAEAALAAYGLMTFAAVAQFAPALIGGLYWRGASRQGVEAGLLIGFAAWGYTLLLPTLTDAGWFDPAWIERGPSGIDWLRPRQLFGIDGWDPLTHGTFWSLVLNVGTLLLVSVRRRPGLDERLRAAPFLDPYAERRGLDAGDWRGVPISDLRALAGRVMGTRAAERSFADYAASRGPAPAAGALADRGWVQFTERLLAAAIGAASARLVITSTLRGSGMELPEVMAVLDEAGEELRFKREILSSTLENIEPGVSVVDRDMRLVAWNRRYQELFGYPDGMLYVGRPVADLIRYNADRGELGELTEAEIDKRLAHMAAGSPHVAERTTGQGVVINVRGQALPGGGYVTSYSDVTDYKQVERALREINETLEQRVAERTRQAEAAQQSRTRFLAALSHDVLQPLSAARLFTSAMRETTDATEQQRLAERVDASLRAAEELLDGLLDISRLEAGALQPEWSSFDTGALVRELVAQYAPMASARGLELRTHAPGLWVRSDRRLLRRVLQNFVINALRYTRKGRVLVAVRPRGDEVALQVWDTGPGIPSHHMRQIYEEFRRFGQAFDRGERGMGLGLSICQRVSHLLGHRLHAQSRVGHGSLFAIMVPRVPADTGQPRALPPADNDLRGMRVLCVDNDPEILAGMRALLERWGVEPLLAATVDQALALAGSGPRVLLVDYHLHDRLDGLDTLDALRAAGADAAGALVTADGSDRLRQAARERGYRVLTKPLKPASLRAFLSAHRRRTGA